MEGLSLLFQRQGTESLGEAPTPIKSEPSATPSTRSRLTRTSREPTPAEDKVSAMKGDVKRETPSPSQVIVILKHFVFIILFNNLHICTILLLTALYNIKKKKYCL